MVLSLSVTACPKSSTSGASKSDAAVELEAGAALADAGLQAQAQAQAHEDVASVYPALRGSADARAERLCRTLHEVPEAKRATCCKSPSGLVMTSECLRMLTGALASKALEIDDAQLGACEKALEDTYKGCDWVGPFPPPMPKVCSGLAKGKVAKGQRCRSSLECEDKLRCKGVGPTSAGVCAEAADKGEGCGGTVDPLATLMRSTDLEQEHPSCKGYCARFKCDERGGINAVCTQSRDCEAGLQCIQKKCLARAPAKTGEACPGGVCEAGVDCILGKCSARKEAGQACKTDFECLGGCVKPKDAKFETKGKCGMRCEIR
jgi:hypothetical protein